jgi:hypothetical protein
MQEGRRLHSLVDPQETSVQNGVVAIRLGPWEGIYLQ